MFALLLLAATAAPPSADACWTAETCRPPTKADREMSREEARDILIQGLRRRGLAVPEPSPSAPDIVDAAKYGFESCMVYSAVRFANRSSAPQEAVKLALVNCASEMNRLSDIWLDHMQRRYSPPPDADAFAAQFKDYVVGYCATMEEVLERQLADHRP